MQASKAGNGSARVEWIDFAKGVGILLVILAHTATIGRQGSAIRGLTFSFHMPLFFILSSLTFRYSRDMGELVRKARRAAIHLLIPGVVVFALFLFWPYFYNKPLWNSDDYWVRELYAFVFASGVGQEFAGIDVPAMGVPWFFFALFFGRTLFDYLHLKYAKADLVFHCFLVSLVGVLLGRVQYLPMSLDVALAIAPLFLAGCCLKDHAVWKRPVRLLLVSLTVWLLTLWLEFPNLDNWSYLELACRRYPMYPLCYLTAVAGTLFICALSILAMKLGTLTAPIVYLGRNSLYMLVIHCLDGFWYRWWGAPGRQLLESAQRIVANLVVFIAFMLLKTAFDRVVGRARERKTSRAN